MHQPEPLLPQHRLSVDDYYKMGEAGIFGPHERVELIEGRLIDMAPIGSDHAGKVIRFTTLLSSVLAGRALISSQNPIRLSDHSEPQPDFAVLRPRSDFYEASHPEPQDVLLIIEVADTSIRYDQEIKLPLYARHGIPEVWLLDLRNAQLEVYRQPGADGYAEVLRPANDDEIAPVLLPAAKLSIAELWP